MEDMPIYISHIVSAMETVGLPLWNTSNVTHIAEHLTLYTEFSRRLVPSHKQIQNMNNNGLEMGTF
jgi:hypothetical protein